MSAADIHSSEANDKFEKRARILDAALTNFSAYGFARTSMADIAKSADMSRPALYLHFRNKEEIFRATLETILDRALANGQHALAPTELTGLRGPTLERALAAQLTTFLDRYHGDLMELFMETLHGDDLLAADDSNAADILDDAARRSRARLSRYFSELTALGLFDSKRSGQPATRWIEMILLSPRGLKQDRPSVAQYRRRLETLAICVAAGMCGDSATSNGRAKSRNRPR